MRSIAQQALSPTTPGVHKPKIIQQPASACAYHPTG
jgi:hypothetical protein